MGLHRRLGPAGRAAGEEPDGGIVAVGGEVPPGRPGPRRARAPTRPSRRPAARARGAACAAAARKASARSAATSADGRAAVLEEILDGVGLELRVDHHYHGADLQDAEQRRHEVGPVGQGDDHALLRRHSRRLEHVGIAVGQRLHLAVGPPSGVGEQRGPVAPAFAHAGIEKEVGDVEVRGLFEVMAESPAGESGEDTITVQPLAAMTWEEARDAGRRRAVAILPVGAIEAHGPHLPLETDVIIAGAMARAGAGAAGRAGPRSRWCCRRWPTPRRRSPRASPARSRSGRRRSRPRWWTSPPASPATASACSPSPTRISIRRISPRSTPRSSAIRRDIGPGGRVSQPRRQALGAPAGRGVPERRLPRRPVRDLDRAGRAPGAGARGDAWPRCRANPASLSRAIRDGKRTFEEAGGARAYFGFPGAGHRRGGPGDGRGAGRDPRRSGPDRARRQGRTAK